MRRPIILPSVLSGYVITLDGKVFTGGRWKRTQRELSQAKSKTGYFRVRLMTVLGKRVWFSVHRLLALHFLPPAPLDHQVRHLDGNRTNNILSNLAWGTSKDDAQDRERHGHTLRGSHHGMAKLTESDVAIIKYGLRAGQRPIDLARRFSVSLCTISDIRHQRTWNDGTVPPKAVGKQPQERRPHAETQ